MTPGRRDALTGAALAAGALALYGAGACPTIYVGDSGELVAAVYTLGIPHPSGYPLYVLLGKLWTLLLPAGGVALRMSLFSAGCAAVAVGLLYRVSRRLGLQPLAAIAAALLFAAGPSLWGEANVQRVYALNALFVLLALDAALAWDRSRTPRRLALVFLLCGLGAANHSFMLVEALAIGVWALARDPGLARRPRQLLGAGAALGVGLLPYAYLPLRSAMNPALDWGDPQTPGRFLAVVLRAEYWGRAWVTGPGDAARATLDYLLAFGPELHWLGAALMLAGIASWRRRDGAVPLLLLIMAGNLAALLAHGSRTDLFVWHRYYIPSFAMAALLAGAGLDWLLPRLDPAARLLPLPLALAAIAAGWGANDRSGYRIAEQHAERILAPLPSGSHLAAQDDNLLFPLIYLQLVERRRPDVDLILQGATTPPPLRFDPDADPLFFTHHPGWDAPGLEVVPVGQLFRVVRRGAAPPPVWLDGPAPSADPPRDYLTDNLLGHVHYMRGLTLLRSDPGAALLAFERAADEAPGDPVLAYNLGLVYFREGLLPEAHAAFARSLSLEPRRLPGGGDAARRSVEVEAEFARWRELERALERDLPPPGNAARHRALAERLAARGEARAARGEYLLALRAAGSGAE